MKVKIRFVREDAEKRRLYLKLNDEEVIVTGVPFKQPPHEAYYVGQLLVAKSIPTKPDEEHRTLHSNV